MSAVFKKGYTEKYIIGDSEALPFARGPQQCFVNDLNAVFFLPLLVAEDRQ